MRETVIEWIEREKLVAIVRGMEPRQRGGKGTV